MTVYKLCRIQDGKAVSFMHLQDWAIVEYEVGKTSIPQPIMQELGYPLMAFPTEKRAMSVGALSAKVSGNKLVVFECEAEISEITVLRYRGEGIFEGFENSYSQEHWVGCFSKAPVLTPPDTIFCDSITPTRKIEIPADYTPGSYNGHNEKDAEARD